MRHKMEKALMYLDQVGMIMATVDLQGNIIEPNNELCNVFGLDKDEIRGTHFLSTTLTEDIEREKLLFSSLALGKTERYEIEKRIKCRNQGVKWLRSSASLTRNTQGDPDYIVIISRDISERIGFDLRTKHLNKILRSQRDVNSLIAREKERGRLIRGICNILVNTRGYQHANISIIDNGLSFSAYARAGQGDKSTSLEARSSPKINNQECLRINLDKDGFEHHEGRCNEHYSCPLHDVGNGCTVLCGRLHHESSFFGVLAVSVPEEMGNDDEEKELFKDLISDVSYGLFNLEKRKESQNHLRVLRKYEQIVSTVLDPMAFLDRSYAYKIVNKAYTWHFGRMRHNMVGETPDKFMNPEDYQNLLKPALDRCISGEIVRFQHWLGPAKQCNVSRNDLYWDVCLYPFFDDNDSIQGIIINAKDLTQHKKLERELVESREKAEAANKAKSQFLANMNHELRTPFNGIMGMMQLLGTTHLDEEQQGYIDAAIKSSQRFTCLLSNILDLSSIEAGNMVLCNSTFNIKEALNFTEEMFYASAREKDIELKCSLDPGLPSRVIGDPVRIKQILLTLVSNAIKYTEKGFIQIQLALLSPAKGVDLRIMFSISDSGIGIPDDNLKTLFDPFVQMDNSHTRMYQGAGLGLTIVKRLVDLMDGNICIVSMPGQGTTIHFVLPFALCRNNSADEAHTIALPQMSKTNLKILLAEDDPLNQTFMKIILKKLGHDVTLASNGQEAVDKFAKNNFDCILMDIQMPVMSGVEATRAIRKSTSIGSKKDIPIIAVTAHTQPGDKERFLEAGMDDYIGKPVSLEDFQRVFSNFFGQKVMQA